MRFNRSVVLTGVVVCLTMTRPAGAQRLGVVAGGTFSELRGLDDATAQNRTGAMFGVSLTLPMTGNIALQPELLFVNKGSKLELGGLSKKDVRIDYLEVPLLLRVDHSLTSAIGPHVYLGPSMSYKLGFHVGCNVTPVVSGGPPQSYTCADLTFKPKAIDFGAVVGAGVDLNLGGFGLTAGARYGVGMTDIAGNGSPALEQRARNGTLTVYGGVLFGKR